MIYIVAAIAGLAGLLFGFDEGVIAGALPLLRPQFAISPAAEGLMTAAVPLGALGGVLAAGRYAERFGRRAALIAAALLFMLGAARLVLGCAVGIAALSAPLYISESAPAQLRGRLVSVYQLAIALGILAAYAANYALADDWRGMFLLGAVPGGLLLAGMLGLRDTPRWLASRAEAGPPPAWRELWTCSNRPALVVGAGLFLLQQFSGINAVIYYAPTLFERSGLGTHSAQIMATIGIGIANWGLNFLVVFSFPVMVSALGLGSVFALYALVCVAGIFFTYRYVPETNGVPLEAIEAHLQAGLPLRLLRANA